MRFALLLFVLSAAGLTFIDALAAQEIVEVPKVVSEKPAAPKSADKKPEAEDTDGKPEETPAGHSNHGEIFNEGPRQKAYLMEGTGIIDFPVTTKNEEAQKFINQGVGQLHGFWYFEAERSFRQAAALDPDCAMAYWGIAKANGGNSKRAKGFIAEAVKRRDKCSRREQLYIDLQNKFINRNTKKDKEGRQAYMKSLERLIYEFPDDLDAKAFLGLAMWSNRSRGIPLTSHLAVDALLNDVLEKQPMHPCHHYRIHLWDYERPSMAVDSSARCGQSAPAIAHMWHMPGHIYSRLKRYADAVWQQEASARVDHAHMIRDRVLPDQIHNFAHNNEWLIRNLTYVGAADRAVDLAKNMLELPRHPRYNTLSRRGSTYYGRLRLFGVLDQFEMWNDLIELSHSTYLEETDRETEQIKRLRYLARAFFRSGDLENGKAQLALLEERLAKKKAQQDKAGEAAAKKERAKYEPDRKEPEPATKEESSEKPAEEKKPEAEEKKPEEVKKEDGADQKPAEPEKKTTEAPKKKLRPFDAKAEKAVETARNNARKPFATAVRGLEAAVNEMKGYLAVNEERYDDALNLFKKSRGVNARYRAEVTIRAGRPDEAEKLVRDDLKNKANQTEPQAALVETLWKCKKPEEARKEFEKLQKMSGHIDLKAPVFARLTNIATKGFDAKTDWRVPYVTPKDVGDRPDLDELGPFRWHPWQASDFTLKDHEGKDVKLSDYSGKPVVVIFYLGYGCLHCAEQLQKFGPKYEEFSQAGIEMLAISSDLEEDLKKSIENYARDTDGKAIPMRILANEKLDVFKAYRCFDDFENMTLHGTFLIDPAGRVLWQDISYDPFMDPDFVLKEAKRLLGQQSPELVVNAGD